MRSIHRNHKPQHQLKMPTSFKIDTESLCDELLRDISTLLMNKEQHGQHDEDNAEIFLSSTYKLWLVTSTYDILSLAHLF